MRAMTMTTLVANPTGGNDVRSKAFPAVLVSCNVFARASQLHGLPHSDAVL
jgi:hypothetical protein